MVEFSGSESIDEKRWHLLQEIMQKERINNCIKGIHVPVVTENLEEKNIRDLVSNHFNEFNGGRVNGVVNEYRGGEAPVRSDATMEEAVKEFERSKINWLTPDQQYFAITNTISPIKLIPVSKIFTAEPYDEFLEDQVVFAGNYDQTIFATATLGSVVRVYATYVEKSNGRLWSFVSLEGGNFGWMRDDFLSNSSIECSEADIINVDHAMEDEGWSVGIISTNDGESFDLNAPDNNNLTKELRSPNGLNFNQKVYYQHSYSIGEVKYCRIYLGDGNCVEHVPMSIVNKGYRKFTKENLLTDIEKMLEIFYAWGSADNYSYILKDIEESLDDLKDLSSIVEEYIRYNGLDCSSFVARLFGAYGMALPNLTNMIAEIINAEQTVDITTKIIDGIETKVETDFEEWPEERVLDEIKSKPLGTVLGFTANFSHVVIVTGTVGDIPLEDVTSLKQLVVTSALFAPRYDGIDYREEDKVQEHDSAIYGDEKYRRCFAHIGSLAI